MSHNRAELFTAFQMLCPVHPACTASLTQRWQWHSNIGDMATPPKLSYVFCQELLSSLPSSLLSLHAPRPRCCPQFPGQQVQRNSAGHSSKPGGSWGRSTAGTHGTPGKHHCSSSWTVTKNCLCWTCQAGEQMTRVHAYPCSCKFDKAMPYKCPTGPLGRQP